MAIPEARGTTHDIATAPRHVYGPRALGALLPAITRAAFRRRAPASALVLADWGAIVGPALAAVTAPRRLAAGTLTIACAGPVALELQHLGPELLARVNAHLGSALVARLRFVQDPPRPAIPRARRGPPDPALAARAEEAVATLPDGPVRAALARLGHALLAEAVSTRGGRDL